MTSASSSSSSSDGTLPDDLVPVGRIAGAYGVKGWIRVVPFSGPRDSVLRAIDRWWLPGSGMRLLEVVSSRPQSGAVVAQVRGIDDRDAAEALKGADVCVSRRAFPPNPEGEYYWIDLIGCRVVNPQAVELGIVEELQEYGAHPLLAVRGPDREQRLIPFVDRHIVSVDLAGRCIVADWDLDY